jgi:hypothetical protein
MFKPKATCLEHLGKPIVLSMYQDKGHPRRTMLYIIEPSIIPGEIDLGRR